MPVQPVLTSKYQSIVAWVKAEVQTGSIGAGDKLPSESELCDRFAVSRSAVRQALSTLVREGWVESRKGVGSFCLARRGGREGDLALVCYYAASYIFPGIVTAFERTVGRSGLHMVFSQSEDDLDKERQILRRLADKGVAGIAIVPVNAGPDEEGRLAPTNVELLREIADSGVGVLLVDNDYGDGYFPSIMLDDEAVGRAAARYLFERGHRDAALVYARGHKPWALRAGGFRSELEALGGRCRPVMVGSPDSAGPVLEDALRDIDFSAAFCANDEFAMALYRAAAARGLPIPVELSVMGVDDSPFASLPGIELTSISHPSDFIGAKAAGVLLDAVASPGVRFKERIDIEPRIVERKSVRSLC